MSEYNDGYNAALDLATRIIESAEVRVTDLTKGKFAKEQVFRLKEIACHEIRKSKVLRDEP